MTFNPFFSFFFSISFLALSFTGSDITLHKILTKRFPFVGSVTKVIPKY